MKVGVGEVNLERGNALGDKEAEQEHGRCLRALFSLCHILALSDSLAVRLGRWRKNIMDRAGYQVLFLCADVGDAD